MYDVSISIPARRLRLRPVRLQGDQFLHRLAPRLERARERHGPDDESAYEVIVWREDRPPVSPSRRDDIESPQEAREYDEDGLVRDVEPGTDPAAKPELDRQVLELGVRPLEKPFGAELLGLGKELRVLHDCAGRRELVNKAETARYEERT